MESDFVKANSIETSDLDIANRLSIGDIDFINVIYKEIEREAYDGPPSTFLVPDRIQLGEDFKELIKEEICKVLKDKLKPLCYEVPTCKDNDFDFGRDSYKRD